MNMPDDRDLEKLLSDDGGEWGALYRKLSRVEPPRRLDRNVLGEAARAVHGHVPRRQRWLVGLGSAAGIVLAAGIAWHVGHEGIPQSSAPAYETPAASAPRRQYVPVQTFGESARRAAPKPEAPASPAATAPASAPPPVAAKARPPAQPQPPARAQPAPAPQTSARLEKQEAVAPAPRVADSVATQGGAARHAAPKAAADSARGTTEPMRVEDGESRAARDRSRDASPEALTRSQEIRNDLRMPPEAWIRRIQWLLDEGRDEQALESLRLLRRTHPDVELPADLKDLQ